MPEPSMEQMSELGAVDARDGIERTAVSAVIRADNGGVLLYGRRGVVFDPPMELPYGPTCDGETLLDALRRVVPARTGLIVTEIGAYLGAIDYISDALELTRQHHFVVIADGRFDLPGEYIVGMWMTPEQAEQRVSPSTLRIMRAGSPPIPDSAR